MKEKKLYNIICFCILLIILEETIICKNNSCFEYSCKECNSTEYGSCTECEYSWTLIDGTCPCYDKSCAFCTTGFAGKQVCKLCKKGYIWDNYECICNITNCEQCGENKCLYCKYGYFYNNTSKKCEKENNIQNNISCYDQNCDTCFSDLKGACINCIEGFDLRKGECNKLIPANQGDSCPNIYYRHNDYCLEACDGVDCPIGYSSLNSLCPSNKCLVCKNKILYIWTECDNSEECSNIIGCLNCISDTECLYCKQGYYLLGGLCFKCIYGCSICTNNYTCEYCLSGFELTSNKQCNLTYNFDFVIELYNYNKNKLNIQSCSDNNCLYCSFEYGAEYCLECKKGYGHFENKCLKCSDKCLTCFFFYNYQYDYNEYCIKCIDNYILSNNGKCFLPCSDNNCIDCDLFNGEEYCKKCRSDYTINGMNCSKCSEGCKDCYFQEGKEYCKKCKTYYYLKDNNCMKCSDENCENCILTYGKQTCISCSKGYKINEWKCSECSEECEDCYFKDGSEYCTKCISNYMIIEGKCIKCSDEKCLTCSIDYLEKEEECTLCKYGYETNGKNCSKCTLDNCASCHFYKGKEICDNCYSGYGLNEEGKCLSCNITDKNCKYCDVNNVSLCNSCKSGYKVYNGKCILDCSVKGCLNCSLSGNIEICEQCKPGYNLRENKCFRCLDFFCVKCDSNLNICKECESNTKLLSGKCYGPYDYYDIKSLENCRYSDSKRCIECLSGYKLDDNEICVKIKNSSKKIIIIIIFALIIILLLIAIYCIRKRKNQRNEVRIAHINNNNNNHNVDLNIRYQSSQEISSSNKIYEKDLSDEFNRQKIKIQKTKLCYICKKNKGKYIGDCGCIVCQEHSNFKNIIKNEENYKICFNCGKTIKNLSLIKYSCNICLQDVPSVCHFKCGCAIEVCENCYINCKKINKKCPGCRANI